APMPLFQTHHTPALPPPRAPRHPASDWVVLTLPDVVAPGAVEVQVYDVFGREAWGQGGVEKMPVNRMVLLDVLGYPAGIYVVVVTDKKGRRYTGKIVK
ncbi:MAG TPA: T9SS type A sorting domain-containing protein, partial [Bacteroidales bacterium]|nr:T9SS type A sorting domain-containing protein [Bacteroidales bacterium]